MHVSGSSWCVQHAVADTITWVVGCGVQWGRAGPGRPLSGGGDDDTEYSISYILRIVRYRKVFVCINYTGSNMHEFLHLYKTRTIRDLHTPFSSCHMS